MKCIAHINTFFTYLHSTVLTAACSNICTGIKHVLAVQLVSYSVLFNLSNQNQHL